MRESRCRSGSGTRTWTPWAPWRSDSRTTRFGHHLNGVGSPDEVALGLSQLTAQQAPVNRVGLVDLALDAADITRLREVRDLGGDLAAALIVLRPVKIVTGLLHQAGNPFGTVTVERKALQGLEELLDEPVRPGLRSVTVRLTPRP